MALCEHYTNKCEFTDMTNCFGITEECDKTLTLEAMREEMERMLEEIEREKPNGNGSSRKSN